MENKNKLFGINNIERSKEEKRREEASAECESTNIYICMCVEQNIAVFISRIQAESRMRESSTSGASLERIIQEQALKHTHTHDIDVEKTHGKRKGMHK